MATEKQTAYLQQVPLSPHDVQPLLPWMSVPQIPLTTQDGKPFDLTAALRSKPSVLVFYRGGWSPHCNRQLGQLREIEPELGCMRFQLIGISPDGPAKLRESIEKHKVSFPLLLDSKMIAAKALGVAYKVDDITLKLFPIDASSMSVELFARRRSA
jgi:peroxiredoxin